MSKVVKYPKVSVVTITYGHEKYITETLDGVLMQEYPGEIEFIIVNDNSPDKSDEIIQQYFTEKALPENFIIKYTKHEDNKGMMANFIWALEKATGKYISLCEGDDYWIDSYKLQKQVCFIEKNKNCVLSFTGAKTLRRKNFGNYFTNNYFTKGIVSKSLFLSNGGANFCTATLLFDRNIIDNLPSFFLNSNVGDFPLALIAITKGEIGFLEDLTTVYRQDSENSWISKLDYKRYIDNYLKGQSTLDQFDDFTHNRYKDISNNCRLKYQTNYIHYQIINRNTAMSFVTVIKNLSFRNNFKYNKQLVKTFLWRIMNKLKLNKR
jgi:glycosyltransferase involved in cell wall biosynthesis